MIAFREQEKKRHTFKLKDVIIDIDTWPRTPMCVELEGPSEKHLKRAAALLDLDWAHAILESPRFIVEKRYRIPVSQFRFFTFKKIA